MRIQPFGAYFRSGLLLLVTACAMSGSAYGREPTNAYCSLFSLYETAADYQRVLDLDVTIEVPVRNGYAGVTRARYRKDRDGNVEEGTAAMQASIRHHPWDWMPGFFTEVLAGYASVREQNLQAGTNFTGTRVSLAKTSTSFPPPPPPWQFSHARTWEAGIGFGYSWEFARMRISIAMLLGPEYRFIDETRIDGLHRASENWGDSGLLRFNNLILGYSF